MWLQDTINFFINSGDQPLVPLFLMYGGDVSRQIKVVQTVVDRINAALGKDQTNLTVTQSRVKFQVDRLRRDQTFKVDNKVVLSTQHPIMNLHLPSKLWRH